MCEELNLIPIHRASSKAELRVMCPRLKCNPLFTGSWPMFSLCAQGIEHGKPCPDYAGINIGSVRCKYQAKSPNKRPELLMEGF